MSSYVIHATGMITDDGKQLLIDAPDQLKADYKLLAGYAIKGDIRKQRSKRSLKQNAWFHSFIVPFAESLGELVPDLKLAGLIAVFGTKKVHGYMARIALGDKVKDRVTGVSGIVMGITTWMTGCDTVSVQPQEIKDGKAVERSQFDITTLDVVEKGVVKPYSDERQNESVPAKPAKAGGPQQRVERPR